MPQIWDSMGRCPLCGSTTGYKTSFLKNTFQCKSCGAKWKIPAFCIGPIPLELVEPSQDGEGKDLLGKKYYLDFWKTLYLDKEEREKITKLMIEYLPTCPICKSDADYKVKRSPEPSYKYHIECRSCGAAWLSPLWDEEKENHVLCLNRASKDDLKGITLLAQEHSIKFWRKVDINVVETPEKRKEEIMWRNSRIGLIRTLVPTKFEVVHRLVSPVSALALTGLPTSPVHIQQKLREFREEERARATERAKVIEKMVLKPECPKCGQEISSEFKRCPYCGFNLKPICPSCGREISTDFVLCPYCGTKLKK